MTAPSFTAASGTITQTAVLSEEVRFAGPNVILETTIAGTISGTLSGTVEDTFLDSVRDDEGFQRVLTTARTRHASFRALVSDTALPQ